ncbi:MAG: peptidylprolyl isomerase [DPANN group archaeon]|nr:peptidylprolyl isomerase [DPANN group archaeon]
MTVKKGDKIKVDYTGTLEDGTVFDSSKTHGQPLEFEAGAGQVIPGFDNAVIGMAKGDEKEVTLEVEDAYGEYNDKLVKDIPKEQLPQDQEVKPEMMLMVGLPNGQQIPAKITEVGDKTVKIDLNHPLAGQVLKFKIKMIEFASK